MLKKMLLNIDRIIERVADWSLLLSGILILIMSFASTYGVARRYLLNRPEPYSYEISTILLVACVLFSLAGLQRHNRHLRVDFIATRLPEKFQKILCDIITPLMALFYVGIMTWKGWLNALYSMRIDELSQSVWEEPLYPTKMMVTLGLVLLCIVLVAQLFHGVSYLLKTENKIRC